MHFEEGIHELFQLFLIFFERNGIKAATRLTGVLWILFKD